MVKKLKDLQNKKGKKGFSMIELIIVIAIMAILVALIGTQLIPYLDKSRAGRDKTTLDTVLTAVQTIAAENEDLTIGNGDKVDDIINNYNGSNTTLQTDFEKYAGLNLTDNPFKSKAANSYAVKDVKIKVNNDVIEGAYLESSSGTIDLEVNRR
ncbi:MAG: type II secretion system protein [Lachnospiraceae bacterium]|nr:type II secretion system protein [Lachnospiraceae bacterium]